MKKESVEALLFIVFVIGAAIAVFSDNGFFELLTLVSGVAFGTLMASDYLK